MIRLLVSAGNILANDIEDFLNSGARYPDYINSQVIFFPANCGNVITVGGHTERPSSFVPRHCPSPFTRSGSSIILIKPDVMAPAGNFECSFASNTNTVSYRDGLGIVSTSHIDSQLAEWCGTSFSSPIVANIAASIVRKHVNISAFLVKALILSSSDLMHDPNTDHSFSECLQGFGKVDKIKAVYSQSWRVCYLLQGEFRKNMPNIYHRYSFLFPEQADILNITVVCGKKTYDPEVNDYIHLRLNRPGVKWTTQLKKGIRTGDRRCISTYREIIPIQRGSRGIWNVDILPHFSSLPINQTIKYGIVITVSSSTNEDVYTAAFQWTKQQKMKVVAPTIVRDQ